MCPRLARAPYAISRRAPPASQVTAPAEHSASSKDDEADAVDRQECCQVRLRLRVTVLMLRGPGVVVSFRVRVRVRVRVRSGTSPHLMSRFTSKPRYP